MTCNGWYAIKPNQKQTIKWYRVKSDLVRMHEVTPKELKADKD